MIVTEEERELILNKVCPLGQVPFYNEFSKEISFSNTEARRFILDSNYIKRSLRPEVLTGHGKLESNYLSFGILESIGTLLQQDYNLYKRLFNFINQVDNFASTLISSCSHAVVIVSHNSFGKRLFPHIHQDSGNNLKTLSLFFKLTDFSNEAPVLTLLDNLDKESKFFKNGYTDHKLLLLHERKTKSRDEIQISNNMCILFDAEKIPHTLSYTDDIWITVVYDHVTPVYNFTNKGRYHVGTVQL
jgi:hypothetical protein